MSEAFPTCYPRFYRVQTQDEQTGTWDNIETIPVDYQTEDSEHRILWFWKTHRLVVHNYKRAIREARRKAWLIARTERGRTRIREFIGDPDDRLYAHTVWETGRWLGEI